MSKFDEAQREQTFERALSEMPDAAARVAEKWAYYCDALPFHVEVPLAERIRGFSMPISGFVRNRYPNIAQTEPRVYFTVLLMGVYLAKTHPIPELIEAARHIETETEIGGIEEILTNFIRRTPNR